MSDVLIDGVYQLTQLLPVASGMTSVVEKSLIATLQPERASVVVANYLGKFVHRAEVVPLIGAGALVFTALLQTLTVEHAFNVKIPGRHRVQPR